MEIENIEGITSYYKISLNKELLQIACESEYTGQIKKSDTQLYILDQIDVILSNRGQLTKNNKVVFKTDNQD